MTTFDQEALRIMLSNAPKAARDAELAALRARAREVFGEQCPECNALDPEDNGCSGSHAVYRCTECGHQWGPGTEV